VRVRFDEFLLDTERRELTRAGAPVPLRPKAMRLLETLVEQRPKAISQKELSARWRIVIGDSEFDLHDGENLVGREHDAAVRIEAPSISRRHARIIIDGETATLEDLRSKNGTWLRGKRIH